MGGVINGECLVYDISNGALPLISTIKGRNRKGFYSKGRAVVSIYFTCNREALVTTGDNRLRYINLNTASQVYKYKGHKNTKSGLRASISDDLELVICPSEDGKIYVWKNIEMELLSSASSRKAKNKSSSYETFFATSNSKNDMKAPTKKERHSSKSKASGAIFSPLDVVSNMNLRLISNGVETGALKNVILVATLDGYLKIFLSEMPL